MRPNLIETNSWFSIKLFGNSNEVKKNDVSSATLRSRKVRLYPTTEQRKIILSWIKVCNKSYNETVKYLRNIDKIPSKLTLRTRMRKNFSNDLQERIRITRIPKHYVNDTIMDVHKAYTSAIANLKAKNIKHFRLRCKRDSFRRQTISIEKASFSKKYSTFAISALGKYMETEKHIEIENGRETRKDYDLRTINHDCRLQYNTLTKHMYLFVPEDRIKEAKVPEESISLDPGLRTFLTGYNGNNQFIEIGSDMNKYNNLVKSTDIKRSKFKNNKKYNKYIRKRHRKISNLVDDLHWKSINFLCNNYTTVKIGKLNTKSCISTTGNLYKGCRKPLQLLSHYTFRQRLKSKGEEYDSNIIEINEYKSSITCNKCKFENRLLGSSKIFRCPSCKMEMDRDWNASVNLFDRN